MGFSISERSKLHIIRDHLRVEWKICWLGSYNIAIKSCLPLLLSHNGTIINVWHAKSEPLQLITRHQWHFPWPSCVERPSHWEVRGLQKETPVWEWRERPERLLASLHHWDRVSEGLSSGSFKWGLVTAGSSWTKLLLAEALWCCSHSALIGFDCVCFRTAVEERDEGGGGVAVKPECVSWCGADTLAFH